MYCAVSCHAQFNEIYAGNDSNNILKLSTLSLSLSIYISFILCTTTIHPYPIGVSEIKYWLLGYRIKFFFISKLFVAFDQYFRSLFSFLRQLFFPIGNRKLNKHIQQIMHNRQTVKITYTNLCGIRLCFFFFCLCFPLVVDSFHIVFVLSFR